MKGMILAAGLGTRLKPWTDTHPKALAVVNGKSLLQRNIEHLQAFGINEVVVNVHHFADQIIDAIEANKGWGSKIIISDETDEVLETGGGLMKAEDRLLGPEPFVLMNVDILSDLDLNSMLNYHKQHSPLATLATTKRETSRYFLFDENNNLVGWRNVKTGEEKGNPQLLKATIKQRAFSGIHVIDPQMFSLIKRQGKFSMVDVYLDLMHEHTIKSFHHSNSKFIDVGKPESIEKAERMFE
jgi:NDP-sugar pyrophosphorylase family protein